MAKHEPIHPAAGMEGDSMQHINEDSNMLGEEGQFPAADFSDDDGGVSPALTD